jgi:hypothetical protein
MKVTSYSLCSASRKLNSGKVSPAGILRNTNPLHELLEDLTWIGNPISVPSDVPPLRAALGRNVLGVDDVVEIIEFLVERNPALVSSRDQDGSRRTSPNIKLCHEKINGCPFTHFVILYSYYYGKAPHVQYVEPAGLPV